MSFSLSGAALFAIGSAVVGSAVSADASRSAGNKAADAQTRSADKGVAEQGRQFDAITKLLEPYNTAATGENGSLSAQQDLLGLNGAEAQQKAIDALQGSAQFKALSQQGNNAILQAASATGGLRGGNVEGALAQFQPALLSSLIDKQYSRLGGITSLGQNAAAMQGNAGMHEADALTALFQQQGAAEAGKYLNQGRATGQLIGGITKGIGTFFGAGGGF